MAIGAAHLPVNARRLARTLEFFGPERRPQLGLSTRRLVERTVTAFDSLFVNSAANACQDCPALKPLLLRACLHSMSPMVCVVILAALKHTHE